MQQKFMTQKRLRIALLILSYEITDIIFENQQNFVHDKLVNLFKFNWNFKEKHACHPCTFWLKVIVFLYLRLGYKIGTCDDVWRKQISPTHSGVWIFPLFRVSDYWSWLGHPYSPVQTNLCWMNKTSNYANSQQTLFWPAAGMHDCVNIDTFHIKDFFFLHFFAMAFYMISCSESWSCDLGFKFYFES